MTKLRPHQERVVDSLRNNSRGQVIVPTGGGKTLCMIKDAQSQFNSCDWDVILKDPERKTIVIVAPRILLAQQLCEEFLEQITGVNVLHVHSGETHHTSTTKPEKIKTFCIYPLHLHTIIFKAGALGLLNFSHFPPVYK